MTAVAPQPVSPHPYPARRSAKGAALLKMLHTTDPKDIAILYLVTSFGFFMAGGAMALLIRGELAVPGLQFLSTEQYNQLFAARTSAFPATLFAVGFLVTFLFGGLSGVLLAAPPLD